MHSIIQSITPLVLIMIAGFLTGLSGLLSGTFRKALSDFCYYFGMPALLVQTIATAPATATPPQLIWLGYVAPVALVWVAATIYASLICRRSLREAAAIAMGSAYGNVIMLGIPLALAQFGQGAATTVAFVVLVHSPVLFLVAALQSGLSVDRQRGAAGFGRGLAAALREVIVDLVTNPIILAIGIGFLLRTSGMGLDPISLAALSLVGQATLPCVLLAMGLSLSAFELKGEIGSVVVMGVLKLVAAPLLAWIVAAHVLELSAADVAVITLLAAMPTGANAYAFASRIEKAQAAVSGAVALSTVVSVLTISAVLATVGTARN